jgi:hypothetical protein
MNNKVYPSLLIAVFLTVEFSIHFLLIKNQMSGSYNKHLGMSEEHQEISAVPVQCQYDWAELIGGC